MSAGSLGGSRIRATAWVNAALLATAVATLFPLLWMLAVSFMRPGESTHSPPPLLPASPTLFNYLELFAHRNIALHFGNSLLLAVATTVLSLGFNVTAGYAFAKLHFGGRDLLFKLLLGIMLIPAQVAMIPLFLMLKELGLVNSYVGVLIPQIANVFGIFLVRQYALTVPDAMLEAARLEGAGELRIYWSIVLPVIRPILVTLAIFAFLASWNDFLWPLIVLSAGDKQTLPVALAGLSREHSPDNEMMMAGSVLTILPVLILFLALQRYYVQGLLAGSVKG